MTKKLSRQCVSCQHYSGGIPCAKGHKPRHYKDGGLRRVCDDFATGKPEVKGKTHAFMESIFRLFGMSR